MSRAFDLVILLSCAGCIPLVSESTSTIDQYSMAAKSWQGAYIEEMIAAWPNPNMHCGSNTIGEAIARYNEGGVIYRIEVRQSRGCQRRFKDRFDRMTRPAGAKASATIEEL